MQIDIEIRNVSSANELAGIKLCYLFIKHTRQLLFATGPKIIPMGICLIIIGGIYGWGRINNSNNY